MKMLNIYIKRLVESRCQNAGLDTTRWQNRGFDKKLTEIRPNIANVSVRNIEMAVLRFRHIARNVMILLRVTYKIS